MSEVEVQVDQDGCVSAGQCVMAAPEVFDQREDDGVVVLLDAHPPQEQLEAVRRAEFLCPAAVIAVRATDE